MLEVLETITDSLASIYLIVRERKPPLEMVECAKASAEALKLSLSSIVESAKITWDSPYIREEARKAMEKNVSYMMEGADALIKALEKFTEGLDDKDYTSTTSGANMAIVKILNGLSCFTVLYDQVNIIAIGECAGNVLSVNDQLDATKAQDQLQGLTKKAIEASDALMRRVNRRIQYYNADSFEHQELGSAIESLQAAGPLHINAVKARLSTPAQINEAEDASLLIEHALNRIVSTVRSDFWRNDRVLFGVCPLRPPNTANEVKMHKLVFKVAMTGSLLYPTAVTGGDMNEVVRSFATEVNNLLVTSRSFAADAPDAIRAGLIEKCCQTLTGNIPKIISAVKNLSADRKSPVATFALKSHILYARGIGTVLFTVIQDALPLDNCVASFVAGISRNATNFEAMLKQSDASCADAGCQILKDLLDHFLFLLDAISRHETDKQKAEVVSFVKTRLEALSSELMVQGAGLCADGKNKKLQDSMVALLDEISSTAKILVPPHVYAYALWKLLSEDEDLLLECLIRKTPSYLSECINHVRAAAASLKEIVIIIDSMKGSISEMRYEILKVSSDAASAQIGNLVAATKGALVNKSSSQEVVETVREAVSKSKSTAEDSVALMSPSLQEINLYWTRIRDLMEKHGVKTSIPSPKDDQLNALATRLIASIPQPTNAEHSEIVGLCNGIGKKLSSMATIASGSTKFRVVEYSREISADTFELLRIAQIVDTKCRDRKRRQRVANALSSARFFTVMMKLSAVAYACSSMKPPLIFSTIRLCSALMEIAYVGSTEK